VTAKIADPCFEIKRGEIEEEIDVLVPLVLAEALT